MALVIALPAGMAAHGRLACGNMPTGPISRGGSSPPPEPALVGIALLTISFQAVKSALANPVASLPLRINPNPPPPIITHIPVDPDNPADQPQPPWVYPLLAMVSSLLPTRQFIPPRIKIRCNRPVESQPGSPLAVHDIDIVVHPKSGCRIPTYHRSIPCRY